MNYTNVYPVIHHLDRETTMSEICVARDAGAQGVFLISHHGDDVELLRVAGEAKINHPDLRIGINTLSKSAVVAAGWALDSKLDMIWADDMGVDSTGLNERGRAMSEFAKRHPEIQCFASVAFKYQPHEADPVRAAINASKAGFIATTSGAATGKAPELEKIRSMGRAAPLAVASGMTPENVADYAPYLAHILVSTGISKSEHHIDPAKLRALIAVVG